MSYYINRVGRQYGPYSLADLRDMAAQGWLSNEDHAWSEGMTSWTPVWSVLKNPPPSAPRTFLQHGPMPPSLPTLHAFLISPVWLFTQTTFVKKIDAKSRASTYAMFALVFMLFVGVILSMAYDIVRPIQDHWVGELFADLILALIFPGFVPEWMQELQRLEFPFLVCMLGCCTFWIVAAFSLRKSLEEYYNSAEPVGLRLSAPLTFLFTVPYIQYHLNRISGWKRME